MSKKRPDWNQKRPEIFDPNMPGRPRSSQVTTGREHRALGGDIFRTSMTEGLGDPQDTIMNHQPSWTDYPSRWQKITNSRKQKHIRGDTLRVSEIGPFISIRCRQFGAPLAQANNTPCTRYMSLSSTSWLAVQRLASAELHGCWGCAFTHRIHGAFEEAFPDFYGFQVFKLFNFSILICENFSCFSFQCRNWSFQHLFQLSAGLGPAILWIEAFHVRLLPLVFRAWPGSPIGQSHLKVDSFLMCSCSQLMQGTC